MIFCQAGSRLQFWVASTASLAYPRLQTVRKTGHSHCALQAASFEVRLAIVARLSQRCFLSFSSQPSQKKKNKNKKKIKKKIQNLSWRMDRHRETVMVLCWLLYGGGKGRGGRLEDMVAPPRNKIPARRRCGRPAQDNAHRTTVDPPPPNKKMESAGDATLSYESPLWLVMAPGRADRRQIHSPVIGMAKIKGACSGGTKRENATL
ncbi:hypothetical protein VTI74DRAFT_6243 [Chaetomium olivicolor]